MQLNDELKKIIENAKVEISKQSGLSIINSHMSCPKKPVSKRILPDSFQHLPTKRMDLIPKEQQSFFQYLFNQKFRGVNMKNKASQSFQQFAYRVYAKNKNQSYLNLSDLYIKIQDLTKLDQKLLNCLRVNLSSNTIEFQKLQNLFHINICSISLGNCGLNNKRLDYLFKRLAETSISHINLSSKTIQKKNWITDLTELYKLIESSQTLSMLELTDIGLNSENSVDLFQYLRNSNVKYIDISRSEGVVGSGKDIQVMILKSNKIKTLKGLSFKECRYQLIDLSYNKLQIRNMQSLFKTQLLTITNLILDQNPLGNLDLLQKFLIEKAHIKLLSVRKCGLQDNSLKSLFNGVEMNNHIENLNVSQNKISRQTGKLISQSIRKLKLKSLNLSECEIWDQSGQLIAKQLVYNRKLKALDLSQNKLSQLTGSALSLILRTNRTITVLKLSQNTIPYRFLKQIQEWIDFNSFNKKSDVQTDRHLPTQEQLETQNENQLSLAALQRMRKELQQDIQRLTGQNTKLANNKQTYEQLQQVYNFLDEQGTQSINKLMDELDNFQDKINEQKEIKLQLARKSLNTSST